MPGPNRRPYYPPLHQGGEGVIFQRPLPVNTFGNVSGTGAHMPTVGNFSQEIMDQLQRYLDAVKGQTAPQGQPPVPQPQGAPSPSQGYGPGGGGGGGGGGGAVPGLDGIHQQYNNQVAEINRQYDAQLAKLEGLHGSAAGGVKAGGATLQKELGGLATDARQQSALVNRRVAGNYDTALAGNAAEFAKLKADLKRQGAGTQGLAAELGAQRSSTGSQKALETSLSQRYGQLLQLSLNDRKALGKTLTTGSLNDLRQILTAAQSNAENDRGGSLAKLKMQLDEAVAAAQERAAAMASRGSGGGGGGGGSRGGGSGGGDEDGASTMDRARALNYAQDALPEYGDAFSGLLGGNSGAQTFAAQSLAALAQGASPQELLQRFNRAAEGGHKYGFDRQLGRNALQLAIAEDARRQRDLEAAQNFF